MSRIADVVNQSSTSITALGQSSDEIHSIIQVIRGSPSRPTCWH